MAKIGNLMIFLLILLTICVFGDPAFAETSIYVFDPNQSTVIQTGGFAGVHETYGIEGKFQLTVDFDAGIASFDMVDANLTEPSGFLYTQSLGVLFNMTGLAGTIIDDTTIEFEGKTTNGTESDVRLNLSLIDGSAHLIGQITPPPNSADMFLYDLNAVAIRKYAGGSGEPNNPYQIATAENLMLLGDSPEDYDKHFILTADINLDPNLPGRKVFNRAVIAPVWVASFTGTFNGKGHTISNLTIAVHAWLDNTDYLGLFGHMVGEVKKLGVVGVNITGGDYFVGGLIGYNTGTVTQCYSTGMIIIGSGAGDVEPYGSGGIMGTNVGDVIDCFSDSVVHGVYGTGGLVGNNQGNITASYSIGTVTGRGGVGGLVGDNDANVTDSFWDMETSGQDISAGGEGKTTDEMQAANTFLEAGWDFMGETENGTEDIWRICEGTNYPRFVWQIPVGDFVCPDGVTIEDFSFFMEHWLDDNCDSSNDYCDGTDLDQSGTVDVIDLEIFFENWPDKQ
jgi:hypothetical protein